MFISTCMPAHICTHTCMHPFMYIYVHMYVYIYGAHGKRFGFILNATKSWEAFKKTVYDLPFQKLTVLCEDYVVGDQEYKQGDQGW